MYLSIELIKYNWIIVFEYIFEMSELSELQQQT